MAGPARRPTTRLPLLGTFSTASTAARRRCTVFRSTKPRPPRLPAMRPATKLFAAERPTKMANGKRAKKTPPDLKVIGGETEVDPTVAASKIAPITVGNPASAASLAIDQAHLEEYAEADSKSSVVECRRPPKGHFFTVRQELVKPWQDRKFYFILELEGRDPHIVSTAIAKQKRDEYTIRPLMLVRYVTMAGTEGLWPVKINQSDGRANAWNSSALTVLGVAEKSWVR